MDRRDFIRITGLASASIAIPTTPSSAIAQAMDDKPGPGNWRVFEITTRVEVQKPVGVTRVWLPTPLAHDTPFQKALGNTFQAEGGTSGYSTDPKYGAGMVWAEWPEGVRPVLVTTSRFATRDIAVDLTKPGDAVYAPAPSKSRNFKVTKVAQTITFATLANTTRERPAWW